MANAREIQRNEQRYEQGKKLVYSYVTAEVNGINDPKEAREHAQESLDTFIEGKGAEYEQAARRFKVFQRVEFIVGALLLIQMAVFLLHGEPYIVPLIFTATFSAIIYVIVAFMDSRSKNRRQDIHYEIQAAKKIKISYDPHDRGIVIEFKQFSQDAV